MGILERKIRKTATASLGATAMTFGLSMAQAQPLDTDMTGLVPVTDTPALNVDKALTERELARLNAPVKSYAELRDYLQVNRTSPFDALPDQARRDFIDSLTFNEKGLTSFRFDVLEEHLSPSEIYALMSAFGAQHTTYMMEKASPETSLDRSLLLEAARMSTSDGYKHSLGDHENYYCESRATCATLGGRICTSNC